MFGADFTHFAFLRDSAAFCIEFQNFVRKSAADQQNFVVRKRDGRAVQLKLQIVLQLDLVQGPAVVLDVVDQDLVRLSEEQDLAALDFFSAHRLPIFPDR